MLKPRRLTYREHMKHVISHAKEEQRGVRFMIEKPFRPKRLVRKIPAFLKKKKIVGGLLIFEVEEGITERQFMPILNAILKRANIPPDGLKIHVLFDVAKKDIEKAIEKCKAKK